MTTTDKPPVETFYEVPSWYEKPALPKGQTTFGLVPPKKVSPYRYRMGYVVQGRDTGVGAGALAIVILVVLVLLVGGFAPAVLTDGLAFFGLR